MGTIQRSVIIASSNTNAEGVNGATARMMTIEVEIAGSVLFSRCGCQSVATFTNIYKRSNQEKKEKKNPQHHNTPPHNTSPPPHKTYPRSKHHHPARKKASDAMKWACSTGLYFILVPPTSATKTSATEAPPGRTHRPGQNTRSSCPGRRGRRRGWGGPRRRRW